MRRRGDSKYQVERVLVPICRVESRTQRVTRQLQSELCWSKMDTDAWVAEYEMVVLRLELQPDIARDDSALGQEEGSDKCHAPPPGHVP